MFPERFNLDELKGGINNAREIWRFGSVCLCGDLTTEHDGGKEIGMGIVFFVLGIGSILLGILLGGELNLFFDSPSLTIVLGTTFFFSFAYHSVGETTKAVAAGFSNESLPAAEAHKHINVLSTMRVLAAASGLVGTLIGLVNMLANMDDPRSIGPAMAVAILTLFYGVLIAELCLGPLISRLRNRIQGDGAVPAAITISTTVVAGVPAVFLAFFIILLVFANGP